MIATMKDGIPRLHKRTPDRSPGIGAGLPQALQWAKDEPVEVILGSRTRNVPIPAAVLLDRALLLRTAGH
jgi:hypothetical protein